MAKYDSSSMTLGDFANTTTDLLVTTSLNLSSGVEWEIRHSYKMAQKYPLRKLHSICQTKLTLQPAQQKKRDNILAIFKLSDCQEVLDLLADYNLGDLEELKLTDLDLAEKIERALPMLKVLPNRQQYCSSYIMRETFASSFLRKFVDTTPSISKAGSVKIFGVHSLAQHDEDCVIQEFYYGSGSIETRRVQCDVSLCETQAKLLSDE